MRLKSGRGSDMGTILEQQAADALASHERITKWRERAKADWARTQDHKITGSWKPILTEQQKAEFEQYALEHKLPF
jgi:hypothetical protein